MNSPNNSPFITVVTVSYNSSRFIRDAIESVLNQTYTNYEYLIIDGGSTDGTLEIVKEYAEKFSGRLKVTSEKDTGIYNAMNKGIRFAQGHVLGFLNSDDEFADETILQSIADAFGQEDIDALYADLVYVEALNKDKVLRRWKSGLMPKQGMTYGWHPPHPTLYVKTKLLRDSGGLNEKYRIGADYALMVTLFQKHKVKYKYVPKLFVRMRAGGESNKSLKNIAISNAECVSAWRDQDLRSSPLLIPTKLARKVLQLF